jgi:antitoxin component of RelBE/YafQ-DinJ toxin-antitoxin module
MSLAKITNGGADADEDDDIRMILKAIREKSTLPDDYKIPSKAWQLLTKIMSKEDRDAFIAKTRHKALEQSGSGSGIPK